MDNLDLMKIPYNAIQENGFMLVYDENYEKEILRAYESTWFLVVMHLFIE